MTDRAALDKELEALNLEVDVILARRKDWMDSHMADYAAVPVGALLYDLKTHQCVGRVVRHYRYNAKQAPLRDREMTVDYEYEIWTDPYGRTYVDGPPVDPDPDLEFYRSIGNTSHQHWTHFGPKP